MLIVCPNCATSYLIDPASLGGAGRTVRCTRCRTSWFADSPEAAPKPAAGAEAVLAEVQSRPERATRAESPPPAPAPAAVAAAEPPPQPVVPPDEPAVAESAPTAAIESPVPLAASESAVPAAPAASTPADAPSVDAPIAEAAPVTVTDAPPLAPVEHEAQPHAADNESDGESAAAFEARRRALQARRKKSRRSSRWTAVILVLVGLNVAMVGARNEIVRYLPQTASLFAAIGLPVNLRSLKFENVKLSTEDVGGITMLTVQGSIVSEAGKAVGVPRLRFAVRNATGQEVYTWTMAPPSSILEPGARLEFRSQVPVPKVEAADVMVRFLTAQDAGVK